MNKAHSTIAKTFTPLYDVYFTYTSPPRGVLVLDTLQFEINLASRHAWSIKCKD